MESDEKLVKWITVLARHCQAYMARELEPMGIGMGQYPLILALCREPGINQDRLSELYLLNKSTVARSIAHLEENGYLTRRVNPEDRRAYQLHPTGKAREALPHIFTCIQHCREELTEGLTPEEKSQLSGLLKRMVGRTEYRYGRDHAPAKRREKYEG